MQLGCAITHGQLALKHQNPMMWPLRKMIQCQIFSLTRLREWRRVRPAPIQWRN